MRRNTHQAQLRQKLKYDRTIRANTYKQGDLVWVFCRYVPQKGSSKLMRAWRRPHRVVHTLQDGRVYILDTGIKVHFERLKPHNSGPAEFAATPLDTGNIAVFMDPEPERFVEPINDDLSKPSYKSEQSLSEASNVSLSSRRRLWMNTRLRTRLRAGGSRQNYQQFDYSTSEKDDESSGAMLPNPRQSPKSEHPLPPPEPVKYPTLSDSQSDISLLDCLAQLFSDHELARSPSPQLSTSPSPSAQSLGGTSAPLVTNPSITDYLSNNPIWPNRAEDSSLTQSRPASPSGDDKPTARSKPPKTLGAKTGCSNRIARSVPTKAQKTAQVQKWHVCLRNCVWVLAVHENREVPIGARGVPRRDDKTKSWYTSIVVRSKKTFSGVERTNNHPVETILQQLATPNVAKAPCHGFKRWTNDGKGLTCCRPSYHRSASPPPNIVFGPFNFERGPVQMDRCITADLVLDRYRREVEPGGVYSPAPHWWLLVTAPRVGTLVDPRHLLS